MSEQWLLDRDPRLGMEWNIQIIKKDAPAKTICFMAHSGVEDNSEYESHANLIASAPQLLEALERLEFEVSRAMSRETDEMSNLRDVDVDAARAAIAAARGGG